MNLAEERAIRLLQLRKMANLTRPELARLSGIGKSTIQFWETGKGTGITPKGAKQLIQVFNNAGILCNFDWLMENTGMVPLLKSQLQTSLLATTKIDYTTLINQEISLFQQQYLNAITLMIPDDAMSPFYQPGDYVAGEKKFGQEIEGIINTPCIIEAENLPILCRILKKSKKKKCYDFVGINAFSDCEYLFANDLKIISAAKVIWYRKPC